jgi:hypothetical protein
MKGESRIVDRLKKEPGMGYCLNPEEKAVVLAMLEAAHEVVEAAQPRRTIMGAFRKITLIIKKATNG